MFSQKKREEKMLINWSQPKEKKTHMETQESWWRNEWSKERKKTQPHIDIIIKEKWWKEIIYRKRLLLKKKNWNALKNLTQQRSVMKKEISNEKEIFHRKKN